MKQLFGSRLSATISLFAFVLFVAACGKSHAAKILALFPIQLKSHFMVFDALMVRLAQQGHNVTVLSGFPKGGADRKPANYHEIDTSACMPFPDDYFDIESIISLKSVYRQVSVMFQDTDFTEKFLSCDPVKRLIAQDVNPANRYDLLITEVFTIDLAFGFVYKFAAPYISISANTPYPWTSDRTGNPDNPSYVMFNHNHVPLDHRTTGSTFWQRLHNTYAYILAKIYFKYGEYASQRISRKYFGNDMPSYEEIAKNVSLVLSFSHFTTNQPQPLVPNIIQIGGIHVKKASPLPSDLEKFLNESTHGVIYFSMGSLIKADSFSTEKREAFLYAFSKIPQRILWKWNGELPNKTSNIYTSKWLPQRDILAHPNVKLFITHGGALGINEAIQEAIPILGIPIFADQTINVHNVASHGAGLLLDYQRDVNKVTLTENIQLLLNDSRYKENMIRLSAIYRDRPMSALDTAVYWTEYVIRHKGAYHLQSAAVNLPWYQYFLLDVITFVIVISFVTIIILYYIIIILFRLLMRAFRSQKLIAKKDEKEN